MAKKDYVIGIDYGTDSVRSVIIDAANGKEISSSVHYYTRWAKGRYCEPLKNQFRQHPLDYIEGLQITIKKALKNAHKDIAKKIRGVSIDTTGSTPVAVDEEGTPLSLLPEFSENPNAMFILWKDHTAVKEADDINYTAKTWGGEDWTKFVGGVYSSEWFWAKILHVLRNDNKVRKVAYSWVEHCDWIPALLTGNIDPLILKRSRCAAGHKAMWHESFGGLPDDKFLVKADPLLAGLRDKLYGQTYTSDVQAGYLTKEWADKLGLTTEVVVGVGAFDAHIGAVGAGITPYTLVKIIGTSTCDMLIAPIKQYRDKLIQGICGQVDGSIIPGMLGMEAGQSAFGDVYAWFKDVLLGPIENILSHSKIINKELKEKLIGEISDRIIPNLAKKTAQIPIEESAVVALDWMNGRRTPDANQYLKGAITGINLGTTAPYLFKALVEATAFGSKKIVERFEHEGVTIKDIIAIGGVARKSPFVMQVLADVINREIKAAKSEQACALGAAMFAATVSGIYKKVEDAQRAMASGFEKEYKPILKNVKRYEKLYKKYTSLGEFIEKETERKV